MSASKYLPPFTTDERSAMSSRAVTPAKLVDPATLIADPDATYADFLGDEVED
jgi:hypothetical protein